MMKPSLIILTVLFLSKIGFAESTVCPATVWKPIDLRTPGLGLSLGATYYGIRFYKQSPTTVVKFHGTVPRARYISLTSYGTTANAENSNFSTWDYPMRNASGSSQYTAYLIPENMTQIPSEMAGKTFKMPSGITQTITVWLRVYRLQGTLILPEVSFIDTTRGNTLPCPTFLDNTSPLGATAVKNLTMLPAAPSANSNQSMSFYHVAPTGVYNNVQAGYLATNVQLDANTFLALRFRAPTASTSYNINNPDQSWSNAEVRFFSLAAVSNTPLTSTAGVPLGEVFDETFASQGGIKTIFITAGTVPSLQSFIASDPHRYAYMALQPSQTSFRIYYRNLVPFNANFLGNFNRVPFLYNADALSSNPTYYKADTYLHDYAPMGRVCSRPPTSATTTTAATYYQSCTP